MGAHVGLVGVGSGVDVQMLDTGADEAEPDVGLVRRDRPVVPGESAGRERARLIAVSRAGADEFVLAGERRERRRADEFGISRIVRSGTCHTGVLSHDARSRLQVALMPAEGSSTRWQLLRREIDHSVVLHGQPRLVSTMP